MGNYVFISNLDGIGSRISFECPEEFAIQHEIQIQRAFRRFCHGLAPTEKELTLMFKEDKKND